MRRRTIAANPAFFRHINAMEPEITVQKSECIENEKLNHVTAVFSFLELALSGVCETLSCSCYPIVYTALFKRVSEDTKR